MDYGSPKVPKVFQAKHCKLLEGFPFLFKNLTAGLVEVLNMTMAGGDQNNLFYFYYFC